MGGGGSSAQDIANHGKHTNTLNVTVTLLIQAVLARLPVDLRENTVRMNEMRKSLLSELREGKTIAQGASDNMSGHEKAGGFLESFMMNDKSGFAMTTVF